MSDSIIKELLPLAQECSRQAYSPYSGVKVGAVVIGKDDALYTGCNMENASYGLTQCAERNALAAAIVSGEKAGELKGVLVETLAPCGACRQVMSEMLTDDALIISCADNESPKQWRMADLLPDPFSLE
jgi:cytidine deaminase